MTNSDFYYDNIDCGSSSLSEDEKTYCTLDANAHVEEDAIEVVGNVLNAVYGVVGVLTVVMVIVGAIQITTSKADPGKLQRGRSTILYALIGLIVTLLAFSITSVILSAVSDPNSASNTPVIVDNSDPSIRKVKYIQAVDDITISVDQEAKLKAKIIPTNATHKNLVYKSSNENIVIIGQDGTIKGQKDGKATVIITSEDGPSKEIIVTVLKTTPINDLVLTSSSIEVEKGKTAYIKLDIKPADATNKKLTWNSANNSIATVTQGGIVTGKTLGSTTVTVATSDGSNISKTITINVVKAGSDNNNQNNTTSADGYETQGPIKNKKAPSNLTFTSGTKKIVDAHMKDELRYTTYSSFMKKHGGYDNYVKSLGGIFKAYEGTKKKFNVKTAADLQAAGEYTAGLFTIWGIDYNNGSTYHNWGNSVKSGGTSDGFFVGSGKRYAGSGMSSKMPDEMLKNRDKSRTNCNYGVDSLVRKTNLGGPSAASVSSQKKKSKVGKITNTRDLKVGDLVHFYRGSTWRHVAIVGEVYSDYAVLYDFGGRFINSRNYKHKVKRGTRSMNGEYSNYGSNWFALRIYNINQDINLAGL